MKRLILVIAAAALALASARAQQAEPSVRIGLSQSAQSVTVRSNQPFTIDQNRTRSAKFTGIVSVDSPASRTLRHEDLQFRMLVELDGDKLLVLPMNTKVRIEPAGARLEYDGRTYRGILEVFGNVRNSFTVVDELPLEDYLLGVVPNELSPRTFGKIEALKAQAVAARTYVTRNMGQYQREGFDICNTDACQVYMGAGTEDALATQAVSATRGVVATYEGKPIQAFYSSTCGGRTESSENIFDEKVPYLVSVMCEFKHPEPKPFSTARVVPDWKDAVLSVAGVSNFTEARRFMGITGAGEPPSLEYPAFPRWIRENFYSGVKPASDLDFLSEQGILSVSQKLPAREVLFRLIDRKGAFEWQQGVIADWDGETVTLIVNGAPVEFHINPNAPMFQRIGEDRVAMKTGMWIGGELMDFRAVDGVIQMAVYRKNFVADSADRFSRLAMWQVHKTKAELDAAFKPLNIGELKGLTVVARGASDRLVSTDVVGTSGRSRVRALRFRTLLGLRDSLVYFDEERNARGTLIGMTFYGQGWGHGVGMCQVGAYGMALQGATYDEILKKYYTGISLSRMY